MSEYLQKTGSSSSASVQDGCPPEVFWFVMRVTYSRELKAQAMLQSEGIECYIPMRRKFADSGVSMTPVIHNLLFVRSNREILDGWKQRVDDICPIRYAMDKSTGHPMIVRDKQMEDFIRVTADADALYLDNPNVLVEKGMDVEVCAGPYKGVIGRLIRIRRDRKVVVGIPGLMAAAVSGIPLAWLKKL